MVLQREDKSGRICFKCRHCFDTYNKLFEMSCSHGLALDVFFIDLESAGSGCKVVEQQSHDEKVLQGG